MVNRNNLKLNRVLKTGIIIILSFAFVFIFIFNSAQAAVPSVISYKSRLRELNGNPVNYPITIQFSLYTDSTLGSPTDTPSATGTLLWTESYDGGACSQIIPDTNGYININLGSCVNFPSYLDFNNPSIYIGVKIGFDSEATPRVKFTSAPFALNSQKINGLEASSTAIANQLLALDANLNFNIASGTFIGTNLKLNSLASTSSQCLTTDVNGNIIFSGNACGYITNLLTSATNTLTSTVNGITSTTSIINTSVASSSANLLQVIINGISSTVANIINSFTQSLSGNTLTTTINGVVATSSVISGNTLSSATNTLTSNVNGVISTSTIINTNTISTSTNTFQTIVNGISSTVANIINSFTQSLSGNTLTTTINGVVATSSVISSNGLSVATSTNSNTITSIVNGVSTSTTLNTINTTVASSSANLWQTIVNGISSGVANIINSFTQSVTGNVLTSIVNGVSATTSVITSNVVSASGTVLTTSVNGVSTSTDLSNLIASSTSNSLYSATNTLTSVVNGVTSTASIINTTVASSSGNLLQTIINGISSSVASIINSFTQSLSGNTLTTTINGVVATSNVIGSNVLSYASSSAVLTSTINGVVSTTSITGFISTTTNSLTSSVNTLTSNVNGVISTSTIINSNTISTSTNTFQTIVNGISSTITNIIDSFTQSATGNVLTTSVNGVSATSSIINSATASSSANLLQVIINGISSSVANIINSNVLSVATSTNSTTVTSNINGISSNTTFNTINSNTVSTSTNTLQTIVNGVSSAVANIINSFSQNLSGNTLTTTINGVVATSSVVSSNVLDYSTTTSILTTTINGVVATTSIIASQWTSTGTSIYYNDGNAGIGDNSPASLFTVGNGDLFQVNATGSIVAVAGITGTGPIDIASNTITSGLINGQRVSSAANFTGTATIASTLNTGAITTTSGNNTAFLTTSNVTTGYTFIDVKNTSGRIFFGVEASTPGNMITSNTAYSGNLTTVGSQDLFLGANQIRGMSFAGADSALTVYTPATFNSTITSGLINGQTISSAANFTGTITSGLINGQTISNAANFTGSATFGDRINTNASGATPAIGQTVSAGSAGRFLYWFGTGGALYLGMNNSAGTLAGVSGASPYSTFFGGDSAYPLHLVTNNTVRMTIDSAGNVGIGTTTPTTKLDIEGGQLRLGSYTSSASYPGAAVGLLSFDANGNILTSASSSYLLLSGGTLTGALAGTSANFSGTITQGTMTDKGSSGNILVQGSGGLIQYRTPLEILTDIGGLSNVSNTIVSSQEFAASTTIKFGNTGYVGLASSIFTGGGATDLGLNSISGNIWFGNNVTPTMFLLANGNLGINTAAPSFKLDVQGDINTSGYYRVASTQLLGLSGLTAVVGNTGSYNLSLYAGAADRLFINTLGNVGIGTTTPTAKLDINGGVVIDSGCMTWVTGGFNLDNCSGVARLQGGDGSTNLPIALNSGGGNVGIGTASPGTTLDVVGSVRLTGNSYSNGGTNNFTSIGDVLNLNKTLSTNPSDSWITGTAGGSGRLRASSILYNGKVYIWGGTVGTSTVNTIDIYNIASGTWSTGTAGGTARSGHIGTVYNGKIYFWGGQNIVGTAINTVDIYDIASNSWTTGATGGTARFDQTGTLYNGKIYYWGGATSGTSAINTVDIYDIANNSWTTGTAGGTARYGHTSVLYNGKIYSYAGAQTGGSKINTLDIYDIASGTWSTGTAGGTAKYYSTSVLYNGKIYSWGGFSSPTFFNIVDIYTIATDSWSTGTSGGTGRSAHTSILYNGKMYSFGGQNGSSVTAVDIYDIGNKQNILSLQENGIDTLNFQSGSQMFLNSGRLGIMGGSLGIGTTAPGDKLTVAGNVAVNSGNALKLYRPDSVSPSTSWFWGLSMDANNVLNFNINGGASKMVIDLNGNVAIGTNSSNERLRLKGATTGESLFLGLDSAGATRLRIDYSTTTTSIGTDGTTRLDLGAGSYSGTSTIPNAMSLLTSGNVGIGSISPRSLAVGTGGRILDLDGGTGVATFTIHGSSGSDPNAELSIHNATNGFYIDATGHATASNNAIIFRTTNTNSINTPTEAMRIASNGVITAAAGIISKNGIQFNDAASSTNATISYLAGKLNFNMDSSGTDGIYFNTYSGGYADRFVIKSSGNVGIGTTAPGSTLHIKGIFSVERSNTSAISTISNEGNFIFNTASTYNTVFQNNSVEKMRLDSSGNLGIGTSSVPTKLEVWDAHRGVNGIGNVSIQTSDALAADKGGSISFGGVYNNAGDVGTYGSIAARKVNGNTQDVQGYLQFNTSATFGNISEAMRITGNTTGGTGGTVSIANLTSCGGIQTNGSGTMSCTSDERLKDVHGDFTAGLSSILKINPKAFSWKADSGMYDNGVIYNGFIAQNVQQAVPEAVATSSDHIHLQVSQLTLMATAINAIKELAGKTLDLTSTSSSLLFSNVGSSTLLNNTLQYSFNNLSLFLASTTDANIASTTLANLSDLFSTSSLASIKALTNTLTLNNFDLNLNGNAIVNIKAIESVSGNWKLGADGIIYAKEIRSEKYCNADGSKCIDISTLAGSTNTNNTPSGGSGSGNTGDTGNGTTTPDVIPPSGDTGNGTTTPDVVPPPSGDNTASTDNATTTTS